MAQGFPNATNLSSFEILLALSVAREGSKAF